jgi:hypothetical protein
MTNWQGWGSREQAVSKHAVAIDSQSLFRGYHLKTLQQAGPTVARVSDVLY